MIIIFNIKKMSIIIILLLITMGFAEHGTAQSLPIASHYPAVWAQTNYGYQQFGGTSLQGLFGITASQIPYSYAMAGGQWFQYPNIFTGMRDNLEVSVFNWYDFHGYLPSEEFELQRQFNLTSPDLSLPLGCQPLYERKTCHFRGACHTPIYCPVYIQNLYIF